MIEDVVVLEYAVAVVVEVHPDLLAGMDAISAQYRRRPSCDPHAGQRVGIHLRVQLRHQYSSKRNHTRNV